MLLLFQWVPDYQLVPNGCQISVMVSGDVVLMSIWHHVKWRPQMNILSQYQICVNFVSTEKYHINSASINHKFTWNWYPANMSFGWSDLASNYISNCSQCRHFNYIHLTSIWYIAPTMLLPKPKQDPHYHIIQKHNRD